MNRLATISGAFALARHLGAPLLPVVLTGGHRVWEHPFAPTLRYGQPIAVYAPQQDSVEKLLAAKGPNSFYASVADRQECCRIRKVEPLGRALAEQQAWVTGIRAEQSVNRQHMEPAEWDAAHQLVKVHPLFDWTWEQAVAFAQQHAIPTNPLHQQGFVSIGCAPCTRAVQPGEDFRAGRWWWEDQSSKECGLHATK